jgi:2-polyprenyl-3-methyl-5-hydroxy-6-metoxy-1,4-benzoquinol methylase
MRRLAKPVVQALLRLLPVRLARLLARVAVLRLGLERNPAAGLRHLLELDNEVEWQLDKQAIAHDGGVHAKHRLMRYHDFFVERVRPGERVLDVGCGKAELAHDLVVRADARVVGIDMNEDYLRFARKRFADPKLELVSGDVLAALPEGPFDVVVLSNVLEHIAPRIELLRRLLAEASPARVLIRVPMWNRHWAVPLRHELGMFAYNDPTHEIEYEPEELRRELAEAGLAVTEQVLGWGEIWVEARPA